jgi:hypothetical protein
MNDVDTASETAQLKQLELLQGIISRMANNSFLIKGWVTTISSALFALGAKETDPTYAFLAAYPILAFWALDAYYLQLERGYRQSYEAAAKPLKLGLSRQLRAPGSYLEALFAPCVWPLYLSVLVVAGLIGFRVILAR